MPVPMLNCRRLAAAHCYNAAVDALSLFKRHFGIQVGGPPDQVLEAVVTAFSRLPYENITKIIKRAECGSPGKSRRYPEEVIRDHIAWGSGGTCFSLTSALRQLVRSLGWEAEYILADRRYGQDTHCALLLRIEGVPHLLDPGFLIVKPIPLRPGAEREIRTGFNRVVLAPEGQKDRVSLSTIGQSSRTCRLTYKTSPVDEGEFFRAWDASFGWDMMRYPLLTRAAANSQIYFRGSRLQVSSAGKIEKSEIPDDGLAARIAAEFSINPSVVARAISILKTGVRH
jgi:arylamine N-acetyltransferase